jgi:hypothetical protein
MEYDVAEDVVHVGAEGVDHTSAGRASVTPIAVLEATRRACETV